MERMIAIDRDEELQRLEEILTEDNRKGGIISVIAPSGTGKTIFVSLVSETFGERFLVLREKSLAIDIPVTFFQRLFGSLEAEVSPRLASFRELIAEHVNLLKTISNAIAAAPGMPNVTPMIESISEMTKPAMLNSQLESVFINLLSKFYEKFPEQKMIIVVDDIDTPIAASEFKSILLDIQKKIPPNVFLLVTTMEPNISADYRIVLSNFGENEVKEFVKANLPTFAADVSFIEEVLSKSGGYPAALGWLWENHRRGADIAVLLGNLDREGFLHQLEANFFRMLSIDERSILEASASLLLADPRAISFVTKIEKNQVKKILSDFANSLVLETVNYGTLSDGEITEFYSIHPTFKRFVELNRGKEDPVRLRKGINYYANAIKARTYPAHSLIVRLMLDEYRRFSASENKPYDMTGLFETLELSPTEKVDLCYDIFQYFLMAKDKTNGLDLVNVMKILAQSLSNGNREYTIFWTRYFECIFREDLAGASQVVEEIGNFIDQLLATNQSDPQVRQFAIFVRDFMKMSASRIRGEEISAESYLNIMDQIGLRDLGDLFLKSKLAQLLFLTHACEQYLQAGNVDQAYEGLSEILGEWRKLTVEDNEQFFTMTNNPYSEVELIKMQRAIEYDLGIACLGKVNLITSSSEDWDRSEVESILMTAVDVLQPFKTDSIRGQYYEAAVKALEDIRQTPD